MKRFTKYFALVLTVAMCLAMLATPASAVAVVAREKTGAATTFDNSWEFSVDVTCLGIDVGVLIYGFNTAWIDEDYVWTKAFVGTSQAAICRVGKDSAEIYGSEARADAYSKIEVSHKTNTVQYFSAFSAINTDNFETFEYPSSVK